MRAPQQTEIHAPHFPRGLPWRNVGTLRLDQQRGRPVLVEFWDFCRPACLRTLPYVKAWHERYGEAGLRVITIHAPGFAPGRDEDAATAAIERLGIEHPVLLDLDLQVWKLYENAGWPARYLFDERLKLFEYHFGEGGYRETEEAIQELLGVEREPVAPLRPEDDPEATIAVPTPDREGAYSGPYEAGAAWAVVSGAGELVVNGEARAVEHPGALLLVDHGRHEHAVLELEPRDGVTVHATCFTPGVAAPA